MSAKAVNRNEPQLVFVYGTLKRGQPGECYMGGGKFIGMCSIPGVLLHLGRYPGLVEHNLCRVTGEVYQVNWEIMEGLDYYENVGGGLYQRRQISTPMGMAWTYYYGHPPRPLTDQTLCVEQGVWCHPAVRGVPYKALLDFFQARLGEKPKVITQANFAKPALALPAPTKPAEPPKVTLPDTGGVGPGFEVL